MTTALADIAAIASRKRNRDVTDLSNITAIEELAQGEYASSRDALMIAIVAITSNGRIAACDRMSAIAEITKRTVPVDPWEPTGVRAA
jgi:hypothetical protein